MKLNGRQSFVRNADIDFYFVCVIIMQEKIQKELSMKNRKWEDLGNKDRQVYLSSLARLYGNKPNFNDLKKDVPSPTFKEKSSRKPLNQPKTIYKKESTHVHIPLVCWFRKQYPIYSSNFIHIPNEGKRSIWEGARLKTMGVIPGCSDMFLAVPRCGYGGYWIELKAPGKKPTELQAMFLHNMRSSGYRADWFDDWEKASIAIKEYLE